MSLAGLPGRLKNGRWWESGIEAVRVRCMVRSGNGRVAVRRGMVLCVPPDFVVRKANSCRRRLRQVVWEKGLHCTAGIIDRCGPLIIPGRPFLYANQPRTIAQLRTEIHQPPFFKSPPTSSRDLLATRQVPRLTLRRPGFSRAFIGARRPATVVLDRPRRIMNRTALLRCILIIA